MTTPDATVVLDKTWTCLERVQEMEGWVRYQTAAPPPDDAADGVVHYFAEIARYFVNSGTDLPDSGAGAADLPELAAKPGRRTRSSRCTSAPGVATGGSGRRSPPFPGRAGVSEPARVGPVQVGHARG